jgi:LysM repeat protein
MLYVVSQGDTLSKIAKKFSVPVSSLVELNHIENPNQLFIGQELQVPNMKDVPSGASFTSPVTSDALVLRAKSMVGVHIDYKLGAGGKSPALDMPSDEGLCDCSGFVCWVLNLSRQTDIPYYRNFGGWIFTDSMEADIKSNAGIFDRLDKPEAGCIVVYGAMGKIGHVGIVSEVKTGRMSKVIHCSSGNAKRFNHHSIQETLPTVFERPDSVWGRFVG